MVKGVIVFGGAAGFRVRPSPSRLGELGGLAQFGLSTLVGGGLLLQCCPLGDAPGKAPPPAGPGPGTGTGGRGSSMRNAWAAIAFAAIPTPNSITLEPFPPRPLLLPFCLPPRPERASESLAPSSALAPSLLLFFFCPLDLDFDLDLDRDLTRDFLDFDLAEKARRRPVDFCLFGACLSLSSVLGLSSRPVLPSCRGVERGGV